MLVLQRIILWLFWTIVVRCDASSREVRTIPTFGRRSKYSSGSMKNRSDGNVTILGHDEGATLGLPDDRSDTRVNTVAKIKQKKLSAPKLDLEEDDWWLRKENWWKDPLANFDDEYDVVNSVSNKVTTDRTSTETTTNGEL
jgi:hypothetical protein